MSNSIFRKSTIDRMNSPEQLNEYIRVARPGVWLLLGAVVLLLVGVIAWGVFGTVTSTVQAGVLAEEGRVVCFVGMEQAEKIRPDMAATIRDREGSVISVTQQPILVSGESFHPYILEAAGLEPGQYCLEVELDFPGLEDGVYLAKITVESIRPITFVTR